MARERKYPLPRNGGGLGRGKPRPDANESSLASPTSILPRVGGGGTPLELLP
jgi:hypothetical protein